MCELECALSKIVVFHFDAIKLANILHVKKTLSYQCIYLRYLHFVKMIIGYHFSHYHGIVEFYWSYQFSVIIFMVSFYQVIICIPNSKV